MTAVVLRNALHLEAFRVYTMQQAGMCQAVRQLCSGVPCVFASMAQRPSSQPIYEIRAVSRFNCGLDHEYVDHARHDIHQLNSTCAQRSDL